MFKQVSALLIILLAALVALVILQYKLRSDTAIQRLGHLEKTHKDAVGQLESSIDRFATFMSGMQAHLHHSPHFPNQEELHRFLRDQMRQLEFTDSIAVSFLDTNHRFVYAFTGTEIDPKGLVGRTVGQFRDSAEINRLNNLLESDEMHLFPPLNLVEGWVGIPLNFRVVRDGHVAGYIAAIINFKNLIAPIDQMVDLKDFVLKFSLRDGTRFDRERVYDDSEVFHSRVDSLSFAGLNMAEDAWKTSEVDRLGRRFFLSTAYRGVSGENKLLTWGFTALYILLIGLSVWTVFIMRKAHALNLRLATLNHQATAQNTKLSVLNQTKDRFFSIIGHDLRGPLGNVIALMKILEDKNISNQEAKEVLTKLTPAAQSTHTLLEDLMQWAQINNQELKFHPKTEDLQALILETIALLAPNADLKSIGIYTQFGTLPPLQLDRNMISAVIRNLVGNAIKFSHKGSEILVSTYTENDQVVMAVKDQGVGMDEEKIRAIHDRHHSSSTGTSGEQGAGLGLTIATAFIAQHKGHLIISSQENQGSEFRVVLPMR